MTIQQEIYTRLSQYTALAALVGTRISPGISNERESNPRVRYSCFGAHPEQTHDGEQDLRDFVLQVDVIADDYDQAREAATACCAALRASDSPLGGMFYQITNDGMDIPEPENGTHRVMIECRVWWRL